MDDSGDNASANESSPDEIGSALPRRESALSELGLSQPPRVECPMCHSTAVLPIVYGLLENYLQVFDAAEQGFWVFGGRWFYEDSPLWRCTSCRNGWGKFNDPNDPSRVEYAKVIAWSEKHYQPRSDEAISAELEANEQAKTRARQAKLQSKLRELTISNTTSWWRKLLGGKTSGFAYGLHPDNPVLCGGLVQGERDYLERLRCPGRTPARFEQIGSVQRTCVDYLDRPDVRLYVPPRERRPSLSRADPRKLALDAYLVGCGCGRHQELLIFFDMYFRGPELAIGLDGWILSPASVPTKVMPCPYCGEELRTPRAKQCVCCGMDWHDPDNVRRLEPKAE
jgi:hypothetical protein